jgi:hypothetical protein
MGQVIRPAAFAREIASSSLNAIHLNPIRLDPIRKPIRALHARWLDFPFAALFVAFMALAWILALAGTAFAVRTVLVMCFATLAGRARRVGVPATIRTWR